MIHPMLSSSGRNCVLPALLVLGGCYQYPSKQTIHIDPITINPIYIREDVTVRIEKAVTKPTTVPADADSHKYDAYGPWQYSAFHGVSRENIFRAATGPTTAPVDDSVLVPADDSE
jgi:hypothetical protein